MYATMGPTLIGPMSSTAQSTFTKKEHTLGYKGNLIKCKAMEVRGCLFCGQNEIIVEPDIRTRALTGGPAKPGDQQHILK